MQTLNCILCRDVKWLSIALMDVSRSIGRYIAFIARTWRIVWMERAKAKVRGKEKSPSSKPIIILILSVINWYIYITLQFIIVLTLIIWSNSEWLALTPHPPTYTKSVDYHPNYQLPDLILPDLIGPMLPVFVVGSEVIDFAGEGLHATSSDWVEQLS